MKPQQGQDPFDLDFEADDDFSVPQSAWRDTPPSAAAAEDPFVDLPPLPDERGVSQAVPDPSIEPETAVPPPAPVQETHPVHEMLAGAEAAFGENPVPRITIHIFCAASETAEPTETGEEPITLTVWDQEVRGGQNEQIEQLNAAFMAEYPHITIDRVSQSFEDLGKTLRLALSGDEAPDVVQANNARSSMGQFVAAGQLVSLDPWAKAYGWEDRFAPSVLQG